MEGVRFILRQASSFIKKRQLEKIHNLIISLEFYFTVFVGPDYLVLRDYNHVAKKLSAENLTLSFVSNDLAKSWHEMLRK